MCQSIHNTKKKNHEQGTPKKKMVGIDSIRMFKLRLIYHVTFFMPSRLKRLINYERFAFIFEKSQFLQFFGNFGGNNPSFRGG